MSDDIRNRFGLPPLDPDPERTQRTDIAERFGIVPTLGPTERSSPGLRERFADAGGRALHTVNRYLKPIFLPQEILFASIAGARDPKTTIFGRLKDIDWRAFTPGVEEAPEVTSGRELLSLFGVEDENTLKWGGIGLELFADPLLAGATIRWAGKGLKSAELVAFGNKLDELSSIGGLYRNSPEPLRNWVDKRVDLVLHQIRDNEGRFLGIPSELVRKAGDLSLPRTQAARLRMGEPGRDVVIARELGTQKAKDVFEEAYTQLQEANVTLFGEPPRSWFQKVMRSVQHGAEAESEFAQLPQKIRDSLLKSGYDFVDNNGFLFSQRNPAGVEVATRLAGTDRLDQATRSFAALQDHVRSLARKEGFTEQAAENVVSRFSKFVEQVSQADAMLGFHLSGYEHVQKKFMEQVIKALGDDADFEVAQQVWMEFMTRAVRPNSGNALNLDFDELVRAVKYRGQRPPGMVAEIRVGQVNRKTGEFKPDRGLGNPSTADRFRFKDPQLTGPTAGSGRTVADILEGEHLFSSLDLSSFIKGLAEGHMRRAYGMFIDTDNFNRYIRTLKEGKIIPNNILNDVDIERALGEEFSAEAKAIRDYLKAVTGEGTGELAKRDGRVLNGSGTPRGFVINRQNLADSMVEDLVKQGVDRREAARRTRDALMLVTQEMQPALEPVLNRVRGAISTYEAQQRVSPGTFGRKFFDARDQLDQETLEMLGEFMNPLVSLQETISAARVRMPAQEFMRRAYHIAKEHGYVRDAPNPEWVIGNNGERTRSVNYRQVKEPDSVYGAFSGKYIHPGLREEIERVLRGRGDRALALQRMRALVSGGYLASPNVVFTNAVGGIITTALAGVGPGRMLKAMAETLRPLLKNDGKDYDIYQMLTQHIGVQETSAVTQNVADTFDKLRLREIGMGLTDAEKGLHGLRDFFEGQLRSPLGAWWAGLDGFQFVEKWLKTATFKTERERLLAQYGNTAEGAARATKEAAEMARISVFDYSELPDTLRWARDYGVLMFPGFTYFMAGRALNSLVNRPGAFALADRMSEAITSANIDEDEKAVAYHSMPDWLKEEQGTVIRTYEAEDGNKRTVMIPLSQMVPTNTQFGGVFAESLGTAGIWKPFLEVLTALTFADGEAVFSRHFGGQVYSPDAQGVEKYSQAGMFLANSLAPSAVRKLIRPEDGAVEGLVPAIWKSFAPVDEGLAKGMYSFEEIKTRIPDRRVEDELITTFVRSTQTVALGGAINGVRKQLDREKMQLQAALGALKRRYERAVLDGDQSRAEQLRGDIIRRREEFIQKWRPIMDRYRELQGKGSRI